MNIITVGSDGCLAKLPTYIKEEIANTGRDLTSIDGRSLAESILNRDAIRVYNRDTLEEQIELAHTAYLKGFNKDCIIIKACNIEAYIVITKDNYSLDLTKLDMFHISMIAGGRIFKIANYNGVEEIEYFDPEEWTLAK